MTDQTVRSDVIFEYTVIDMELDFIVFRHFFGSGKKLDASRRTRRYRTLRLSCRWITFRLLLDLKYSRFLFAVYHTCSSKCASANLCCPDRQDGDDVLLAISSQQAPDSLHLP